MNGLLLTSDSVNTTKEEKEIILDPWVTAHKAEILELTDGNYL